MIRRLARWPIVSLLILGMWACQLAFAWRRERLGVADLLDVREWYTPEQAAELLGRLGADGRGVYALTEVTVDIAFPIVYGLLFAILLSKLFPVGRIWVLLPICAALADVAENLTIATLAWTYDGAATPLAWVAAVFTALKSALVLLTLLAVLLGALRSLGLPRS